MTSGEKLVALGIGHDLFISSAALAVNGTIKVGVAEERLNRQKGFKGFPKRSIEYCLQVSSHALDEIDVIAVGWNPARHMEYANYRQSSTARWRPEYLYAIPNLIMGMGSRRAGSWIEQAFDGLSATILYVDHHLAHAANAYYLSGFERAAYCVVDGRGEHESISWGRADQFGIHPMGSIPYAHSLGLVYSTITQFLGFVVDQDEWKVMALAAYGRPFNRHYKTMGGFLSMGPNGTFYVDHRFFAYHTAEAFGGRFYSPALEEVLGPSRPAGAPMEQRHYDIAWALQRIFEETMTQLFNVVFNQTREAALVAAGGCLMNSVFNGHVTSVTPFRQYFVSTCPDDSGISVGSALFASNRTTRLTPSGESVLRTSGGFWGPEYNDQEIAETLRSYGVTFEMVTNPEVTAARFLQEGHVVGWFQGKMEFGQRALGNRSILLDPRRADGRDLVNRAVKYRESFRPFAPAVIAERAHEFFDIPAGETSYFMERVFPFKEQFRDMFPAVVHVDGSGRLQTVDSEHNPLFYRLICEFELLTGVPLVLNTSFNVNAEAIVCSPMDAVRTFFSCGIDRMIIGRCVIRKNAT